MAGVRVETIEKDHGYKRLLNELDDVKGSFVDIGVFGGRNNRDGVSILKYALVNEFGSDDGVIPERSFLRSTVDENKSTWLQEIDAGLTKIGLGQDTAEGVLTRLGIKIRGAISQKIRDIRTPPNAASTVAQKGSSNPLVNHGDLRRAIEYKLGGVYRKKLGAIV